MKMFVLSIIIFAIILSGAFFFLKNEKVNNEFISEKMAVEIEKNSIGNYNYDKAVEISINLNEGVYYIAFPFAGSSKRKTNGPFDALRVQVEAKTGKVLSILEDPN